MLVASLIRLAIIMSRLALSLAAIVVCVSATWTHSGHNQGLRARMLCRIRWAAASFQVARRNPLPQRQLSVALPIEGSAELPIITTTVACPSGTSHFTARATPPSTSAACLLASSRSLHTGVSRTIDAPPSEIILEAKAYPGTNPETMGHEFMYLGDIDSDDPYKVLGMRACTSISEAAQYFRTVKGFVGCGDADRIAKLDAAFSKVARDLVNQKMPLYPRRRGVREAFEYEWPELNRIERVRSSVQSNEPQRFLHATNFRWLAPDGKTVQSFPNAPAFFTDDSSGGEIYATEVARTTMHINPHAIVNSFQGGGLDWNTLSSRKEGLHEDAVLPLSRWNMHNFLVKESGMTLLRFDRFSHLLIYIWDTLQDFRDMGLGDLVDAEVCSSSYWEGLRKSKALKYMEGAKNEYQERWSFGNDALTARVFMDMLRFVQNHKDEVPEMCGLMFPLQPRGYDSFRGMEPTDSLVVGRWYKDEFMFSTNMYLYLGDGGGFAGNGWYMENEDHPFVAPDPEEIRLVDLACPTAEEAAAGKMFGFDGIEITLHGGPEYVLFQPEYVLEPENIVEHSRLPFAKPVTRKLDGESIA